MRFLSRVRTPFLVFAACALCNLAHGVIIDNVHPRLDRDGNILRAGEGKLAGEPAVFLNTTESSPIIYLIRHGEKDSRGCLSSSGQKRAKNLEDLFSDHGNFSKPKSLYAYHYPVFTCQRCKQMLTPISQHLDKKIDFDYGSSPDKASEAMRKSMKDSKAPVLAAWEHEHIHDLAEKLGAKDVPHWKDDDYDTVYVLTFDSSFKLTSFNIEHQNFKP